METGVGLVEGYVYRRGNGGHLWHIIHHTESYINGKALCGYAPHSKTHPPRACWAAQRVNLPYNICMRCRERHATDLQTLG